MPYSAGLLVNDMRNAMVAIAHRAAETVAVTAGPSERAGRPVWW
ncbi:hypothetical protein [Streptomyces sp. b94]|nr:hypothetical protein [Streptomyces sp. b94]